MRAYYLAMMEKALEAYSPEGIRDYIQEAKSVGITEHGFARLASNIGILLAYGRKPHLRDTFIEMMELCMTQLPNITTAPSHAGNDFTIREICTCLDLMEKKGTLDPETVARWRARLATVNPWETYHVIDQGTGGFVGNWAMFAAVSEWMRGLFCGVDTLAFVEHQIPSQLANLDRSGLYMDNPPIANPMVYDLVFRYLSAFLLLAGYRGRFYEALDEMLDKTADLTLRMQSVTGEFSFGGRSNQFLHNEAMLISYCEMEAARHRKKGDLERAGKFKAAARLAAETLGEGLNATPCHHIKNRYPLSSQIGCEGYGYFNKYMITAASNLYPTLLFGQEDILPTVAPAQQGGFVAVTSPRFHKVFLTAGDYHAEAELLMDPHYDANGIGRIHKKGCPGTLCLSVPFPKKPKYTLEQNNLMNMSLAPFVELGKRRLYASECYANWSLKEKREGDGVAEADFEIFMGTKTLLLTLHLASDGVLLSVKGDENVGFSVPVFAFDGENETERSEKEGEITVAYQGATCRFCFDGKADPEPRLFYNRNGRYLVYEVKSDTLRITMEAEK